jgi:hypothetical protein
MRSGRVGCGGGADAAIDFGAAIFAYTNEEPYADDSASLRRRLAWKPWEAITGG